MHRRRNARGRLPYRTNASRHDQLTMTCKFDGRTIRSEIISRLARGSLSKTSHALTITQAMSHLRLASPWPRSLRVRLWRLEHLGALRGRLVFNRQARRGRGKILPCLWPQWIRKQPFDGRPHRASGSWWREQPRQPSVPLSPLQLLQGGRGRVKSCRRGGLYDPPVARTHPRNSRSDW